jgi:hypothetical protein
MERSPSVKPETKARPRFTNKQLAITFGVVLLQVITISAVIYALTWHERSRVIQDPGADLTSNSTSPEIRNLVPPPEIAAKDIIQNASFIESNNLKTYVRAFPLEFVKFLSDLRPRDVILDAGAGEAFFIEQYITASSDPMPQLTLSGEKQKYFSEILSKSTQQRARVIGVDVEIRRKGIPSHGGRLRMFTGRLFDEIPNSELGRIKLLSDYFGVIAYTPDIDTTLRKFLEILSDDGQIFVYLGDRLEDSFANQSRIHLQNGKRISLMDWIVALPGIEATQLSAEGAAGGAFSLRIRILDRARIHVPELQLMNIRSRPEAPPIRTYVER